MLSYCPFCHSSDGRVYKKDEKTVSGGFANVYKCNSCAALYPYPRMDIRESSEYLGRMNTSQKGFKFDDPTGPIGQRDRLVKLLKQYTPLSGNALDVGTFDGRFCFVLKSLGFRAYGVEPQENAAAFARDHGLNVSFGSFPRQLPEELLGIKFNLISFMESVYYFEDLKESLSIARDMLNDPGQILIKAHQSGSRYYHGKSFFSRYGDYVQWLPTYDFMKYCLKKTGFKIIKIIGTNPAELLPLGVGWIKNTFLFEIINKVYNRAMLDCTLLDIKRADRLIVLAEKI